MNQITACEPAHEAVLVVNTHSRRGQAAFDEAARLLIANGIILARKVACGKRKEMYREVKRAMADKIPVLIAGGGDGTLSGVANMLLGSETALGVLPLGTGNSFARDLGIAPELRKACEVIGNGKIAHIDVGIANGSCFPQCGDGGAINRDRRIAPRATKCRFGRVVYAYAVARAFDIIDLLPRPLLSTECGSITFLTLQIVIGNGGVITPVRSSSRRTPATTTGKLLPLRP